MRTSRNRLSWSWLVLDLCICGIREYTSSDQPCAHGGYLMTTCYDWCCVAVGHALLILSPSSIYCIVAMCSGTVRWVAELDIYLDRKIGYYSRPRNYHLHAWAFTSNQANNMNSSIIWDTVSYSYKHSSSHFDHNFASSPPSTAAGPAPSLSSYSIAMYFPG